MNNLSHLYTEQRWRKARRWFLKEHPLCAYCQQSGKYTRATIIDHKTPHRGDPELFWDEANWQPLCKTHHDSAKQASDKGNARGCDANGLPLHPNEHWR